jgi:dihydroorotate dehydrogenase
MIWPLAKRVLFSLDAESAHRFAATATLLGARLGGLPIRLIAGEPVAGAEKDVFGIRFKNPLGLAAGFDKNAELLSALPLLGFGFAEIGTVTPRPQPGNPRPRLFRDAEQRALFNRMGFNNLGAQVVAERIARARPTLPSDFRVGVNVGKNKDTEAAAAASDFARATEFFDGLADYIVVNVSSPNTPGLRDLQTEDALKRILGAVLDVISKWKARPPVLLKLAPELQNEVLIELIHALERFGGVSGWVLTNTLGGKFALSSRVTLQGGWSGRPLTSISRERLASVRVETKLPVISVGGILDEQEALSRLSLGADLLQIYSGWIFSGPRLPSRIVSAIAAKNS